jgi:diacylglycerol kinase (ATP)
MEHIFIINPAAGKADHSKEIIEKLKQYDGQINYSVYITKGPGDAIKYCNNFMMMKSKKKDAETYRFYACGGDGTLNEVINGVVGFDNVEVASNSIGSGNDFCKNFGKVEDFQNLDKLIHIGQSTNRN